MCMTGKLIRAIILADSRRLLFSQIRLPARILAVLQVLTLNSVIGQGAGHSTIECCANFLGEWRIFDESLNRLQRKALQSTILDIRAVDVTYRFDFDKMPMVRCDAQLMLLAGLNLIRCPWCGVVMTRPELLKHKRSCARKKRKYVGRAVDGRLYYGQSVWGCLSSIISRHRVLRGSIRCLAWNKGV